MPDPLCLEELGGSLLELFDFRKVCLNAFDVVLDVFKVLEAFGLERAVRRFQDLPLQVNDHIDLPLELAHFRSKDIFECVAVLSQFPARDVSMYRKAEVQDCCVHGANVSEERLDDATGFEFGFCSLVIEVVEMLYLQSEGFKSV